MVVVTAAAAAGCGSSRATASSTSPLLMESVSKRQLRLDDLGVAAEDAIIVRVVVEAFKPPMHHGDSVADRLVGVDLVTLGPT